MGTVKYTGPVASFHCPTNAEIRSLKVHFSPKQEGSGDPSPENVRPIVGWDGVEVYRNNSTTDYEFGVLGKNKFNGTIVNQNIDSKGKILATDLCRLSSLYVPISSGTYTLSSAENYPTAVYVYKEDNDDSFITNESLISWNESPVTFTINEGKYVSIKWEKEDGSQIAVSDISNIQLELGSTATEYEPYDPNHTVYGGWVDLISGEVCEEWIKAVCNDSSLWEESSGTQDFRYAFNFTGRKRFDTSYEGLICSSFLIDSSKAVYARWTSAGIDRIGIKNKTTSYALTDIQQMAENGDISICYELATPNTYHIATTQLQTFLGQNNIWSNADYVEVEYDLHETQTILARKQFIVASQPHVVKPAAAPLQNFVTDMAAPLKECKVYFEPIQDLNGYSKPWVGGAGKNLFNINAVEQDPDNTAVTNASVRKFVAGTYAKGASYSNYWQAGQIIEYTTSNNAITVSATTGYGVGFPIKMTGGTTYFISCSMTGNSSGQINISPYDSEGNYLGDAVLVNYVNQTYVAPSDIDIGVIIFRNKTSKDNPISTTFSNIQVEVGSTATSYEPYENICPIEGRESIRLYHSGKNILPRNDANVQNQQQIDFPGGVALSFSSKTTNDTRNPQFIIHDADGTQLTSWTMNQTDANNVRYRNNIVVPQIPKYRVNGYAYDAQAEIGETYTEYEPFVGSVNSIEFPTEVGTIYGGYIDLIKGELVQEYGIVDLGTLPWHDATRYGEGLFMCYASAFSLAAATNWIGLSDKFPFFDKTYQYLNNVTRGIARAYLGSGGSGIAIKDANITLDNLDTMKTTLSGAVLVYQLLTPIVYTLTPTQLKSLRGQNNIWSSAGDVMVKYWKH